MAMILTNNSNVQGSFNLFPGYADKMSSPGGFNITCDYYTCLAMCLFHVGCNVVFYDKTTKECSGASDIEMVTFLGSLIDHAGSTGYRLLSECDSHGYTLNRKTGQCLKIVAELKMWQDARQYCEDDGSVLVKLETVERIAGAFEISKIYLNIEEVTYHVGASDIASEGTWTWLDGTDVDGIPVAFNDENFQYEPRSPADCGWIISEKLKMYDDACVRLKYFICERRELELK